MHCTGNVHVAKSDGVSICTHKMLKRTLLVSRATCKFWHRQMPVGVYAQCQWNHQKGKKKTAGLAWTLHFSYINQAFIFPLRALAVSFGSVFYSLNWLVKWMPSRMRGYCVGHAIYEYDADAEAVPFQWAAPGEWRQPKWGAHHQTLHIWTSRVDSLVVWALVWLYILFIVGSKPDLVFLLFEICVTLRLAIICIILVWGHASFVSSGLKASHW